MTVPPFIRLGCPPDPVAGDEYVLLVDGFGWVMGRWSPTIGWFTDVDNFRKINPTFIRCYLPQDGT